MRIKNKGGADVEVTRWSDTTTRSSGGSFYCTACGDGATHSAGAYSTQALKDAAIKHASSCPWSV